MDNILTFTPEFPMYEDLYGSYVQMNDRFESVHIWSQELALRNKGRWIPQLISKKEYDYNKEPITYTI